MMRLDAAIRIDSTCDSLETTGMNGPPAGTVTLTHGVYTPDDLAAEMEIQLQADVHASNTVTIVDGYFVFAWSSGVGSISWGTDRLQTYVGCTATLLGSGGTMTAPNVCQGIFIPTLPWTSLSPLSWTLSLARAPTFRGSGRAILRALHRNWNVTARAKASELTQFRGVLGQLLAGLPGRWWQDIDNPDPFGTADPLGYVDVWLSPDSRSYVERWMNLPARLAVEVDLDFAEYVTP